MKHRLLHYTLSILLVFVQFISIAPSTWAQNTQQKETKEEKRLRLEEEKRQKQERDRQAKEEKTRVKQQKQYNTLLEFGEDQYRSNPEFKDEVDKAYLDLQGQHAMQAYQINTQRNTELVFAETEDATLKIRRVLYDNPWVQDYVNRVGQRLVPSDSEKIYAFKVTYHPIPYAYTLSTGTVLISTGMISMLDNEAQLAYVLGHELAHVYKDHWKTKIMMSLAEEDYNAQQARKVARWAGLLGLAGAAIGGATTKSASGAVTGGLIGAVAGLAIGAIFNRQIGVDWETVQENEADDFSLKLMLDNKYDAIEIPKIYLAMDEVARLDERVQLGFLGHRPRIRERKEHVEKAFQPGPFNDRYQDLLKANLLVGNSPNYPLVMAGLKRDNGIEAYKFDMFQMARRNLQQAVAMRSDDVRASFYYGRVMRLVGRTKEEIDEAEKYLNTAVSLDQPRQNLPEVQLQKALLLIDKQDPASVQVLKDYIIEYQRKRIEDSIIGGTVPANIDTLYDLMRIFGKEMKWEPPRPELSISANFGGAAINSGTSPHPTATVQPASQETNQGARQINNPITEAKENIKEGVKQITKPPVKPKGRRP